MTVLAILTPDGPRLVDAAQPLLTADDLGVLRGESVFETVRIARGRPALLAEHLERLAASAARLAITLPRGLEALAATAVGSWEDTDGVLRLVCTKGPSGGRPVAFALVTAVPAETVRAREDGVSVVTLTLGVSATVRAEAPWLLGGVKATSYAVNMASLRHAENEGAQDAIWISSDGEVLEAPTATVAWVRDGVLITPPPIQVSILPGTTVALALRLLTTPQEIRRGTAAELADADEVMLLSSIRGVAPVTALDGRPLGIGPVTAGLRAAVEAALQRS